MLSPSVKFSVYDDDKETFAEEFSSTADAVFEANSCICCYSATLNRYWHIDFNIKVTYLVNLDWFFSSLNPVSCIFILRVAVHDKIFAAISDCRDVYSRGNTAL